MVDGDFVTVGDFSLEQRNSTKNRVASIHLMLRGLLVPSLVPQLKVSKEYADRLVFSLMLESYF